MGIPLILGLAAGQVTSQALASGVMNRLLARSRSIVERRQRAVSQGSLDTALNRLVMHTNGAPNRVKRRVLTIGEQHLRALHPAPSLHSRPGININLAMSSSVIAIQPIAAISTSLRSSFSPALNEESANQIIVP